jgi:hypothetical protein
MLGHDAFVNPEGLSQDRQTIVKLAEKINRFIESLKAN